jgi:hypothetical protein
VDKALNYVFSKDRDFQGFLKTPRLSRLPLRCVSVKAAQWCGRGACKEACSRGGVHGFCASGEGMIRHSISCRATTVLRTGRILTLHPW